MSTSCKYTVYSPWGEVDAQKTVPLNPRLDNLNKKTIGLLAHFKGHSPYILREVENEILKKYPEVKFSHLQYPKDTSEIENDPDFLPIFQEWLSNVDGVISAYGDAGSCAMYHAINTAFVERCGKPAVMLQKADILSSGLSGAKARHVPNLRFVLCKLMDQSFVPELDNNWLENVVRPAIIPCVDELIDGLIRPLTKEESTSLPVESNKYAHETFTGTLTEVQQFFYQRGYTNGEPIVPPTQEAIDEMLTGTDLPRDTVIAKLPPMNGNVTVEKIAICGVMAGCNPTYMPILIAIVKAMANPIIHLVGWTCSVAGFAPIIMINGPIRKQIGLNCGNNLLSPYFKPNNVIPKAISYIIANISGVRPSIEDNAYTGHEMRFGVCFGEDEENSPWAPYHVEAGYKANDNTVTITWAHHRSFVIGGKEPRQCLHSMLTPDDPGAFDPGCTYVISPEWARMLSSLGMDNRAMVQEYIGEYARKPAGEASTRWMTDNNHKPKYVPLPERDGSVYVRKFFDNNHLNIFVAGSNAAPRGCFYPGGGDHGGPCTTKIDLPNNWDELVNKYSNDAKKPEFIVY